MFSLTEDAPLVYPTLPKFTCVEVMGDSVKWGKTHLPVPAWVVEAVGTHIFRTISVRNGTALKCCCTQVSSQMQSAPAACY